MRTGISSQGRTKAAVISQGQRLKEKVGEAVHLLSVGQVADELQVSPSTVRNWVEKGYIHAFRLPSGVRRIPADEVTRLVNDYFKFAAPVEGEDEPTLVIETDEDEASISPFQKAGPADSSGQSSSV